MLTNKNKLIIESVFLGLFSLFAGISMAIMIKEITWLTVIGVIITHMMLLLCAYNTNETYKEVYNK